MPELDVFIRVHPLFPLFSFAPPSFLLFMLVHSAVCEMGVAICPSLVLLVQQGASRGQCGGTGVKRWFQNTASLKQIHVFSASVIYITSWIRTWSIDLNAFKWIITVHFLLNDSDTEDEDKTLNQGGNCGPFRYNSRNLSAEYGNVKKNLRKIKASLQGCRLLT